MKVDKSIGTINPGQGLTVAKGQQIAVIGGTGGLGRAISQELARRGAEVTVVGQTFRDAGTPGIRFLKADLNLMSEARRVAAELPAESLHMVIFTTGIFAAPQRQQTAEGLERDMAVSYLSRLVILRAIGPRLGKALPAGSAKPRVFIMGFPGTNNIGVLGDLNAEKAYKSMEVHMNTVAGNEMLVIDGVKRYPNALVFGLTPGLIKSNIRSNLFGEKSFLMGLMEGIIGLTSPSVDDYAKKMVPVFLSPQLDAHTGAKFNRKGQAILSSPGLTDEHIKAFLRESEELVMRTEKA